LGQIFFLYLLRQSFFKYFVGTIMWDNSRKKDDEGRGKAKEEVWGGGSWGRGRMRRRKEEEKG
jgi:hypothetical protein